MAGVIVADLPELSQVGPSNYLIVETPNQGQGTYKSTVSNLQKAITVTASVTKDTEPSGREVVHITVKDINGTADQGIVVPTAKIVNNSDNTSTIILTDAQGTTTQTVVNRVIFDTVPTQGSNNVISSGTLYTEFKGIQNSIDTLNQHTSNLEERLVVAEDTLSKVRPVLMWEGTRSEWNSLPQSEKSQYKMVSIADE